MSLAFKSQPFKSQTFNSQIVSLSEVPYEHLPLVSELRRPILLVVDDDALVADTLTRIFACAGYSVLTAYDGTTALEMARAFSPDMLVSDVHMAGMTGIELAMSVMELEWACGVILCSGFATYADLAMARAAGHEFPLLTKPVQPKQLLKQVAAILSGESAWRLHTVQANAGFAAFAAA